MGVDSSMRRPTWPTILSMMRRRWVSSTNDEPGLLDLAVALDEDQVGAVDHDLGDVVVLQQPVDGAVAEDVVGDVLDELGLVGGREGRLLLGQGGVQGVLHALLQVVLGEPLVVEGRAQLFDEVGVDLLAQLVEDRVAAAAAGRGCLNLVQALVERH